MKRAILTALLAALFALPVSAHHVDVAVADSDYDARITWVKEYVEQRMAIMESVGLYGAAKSAAEKADALLLVENALTASIAHMRGLDVRECFALYAQAGLNEFEDAAAYFAAKRANDAAAEADALARANEGSALMQNARFAALFTCEDGALA